MKLSPSTSLYAASSLEQLAGLPIELLVCDIDLPVGLQNHCKSPTSLFIPAAKEDSGHLENNFTRANDRNEGRQHGQGTKEKAFSANQLTPKSEIEQANPAPKETARLKKDEPRYSALPAI
ncbi:MAG: hypothetical protein P8J27_00890 [Mariniblastus sp.]|nr:hypothetical protein [Mariniblastus sp.]